jgi:hypothetical protein
MHVDIDYIYIYIRYEVQYNYPTLIAMGKSCLILNVRRSLGDHRFHL